MNKKLNLIITLLTLGIPSSYSYANNLETVAAQKKTYSLRFDTQHYTKSSLTINGQSVEYRAFEHIVYVKYPVDTQYQQMNIYIPEAYFEGKSIGHYTAKNAPIFLPNNIGGYMPAEPGTLGMSREGNGPNAASVALAKGYIVAGPGARGRTLQNMDGQYTGKAPAAIVDLKAAVRYLRYNDKTMPGDAEKIISNGTSAGGAMSALLGASGNSKAYSPYLKAIGAANARDDVFAVSAYCPITNLENADAAYEWQFNGINDYKKVDFSGMMNPGMKPKLEGGKPEMPMKPKEITGTLTLAEIQTSNALKVLFPSYLNSLKLKDDQGNALTLDVQGNGSFKTLVKAQVIASAQAALNQGTNLSASPWVSIKDGKVTDINYDAYLKAVLRMKTPPAFDALDLSSGENDLFGSANIQAQHFTAYASANSAKQASTANPAIVKLMNPMNYISNSKAGTAKYWRIRHGTADRDTSLAISAILATKLKNTGKVVDYAFPWARTHSGDYDLDELFAWVDKVSQ